ncbi:hypothetical protein QBC34DRAFT_499252 [Podospora aff. communis PSN243]|uniref:SMP-30/Gluconolactonase/LRE-like region domain-containing protein n=1 Tax=Podospora aff. communis PSN243 TaxID=3040156 RepID=A0AAV9G762_9PEZI|nr:hypothetical protein QBC34DRAFT_499252 [Podospora aff. communis PSN243]
MRQILFLLASTASLTLATPTNPPHHAVKATELLQFPNSTRLENLKILPNGHIITGSLGSTTVYTVDPHADPPTPNPLVTLPRGTSLFGITPLSHGLYAIVSGNASATPHRYVPGSYQIHVISPLSSGTGEDRILRDSIPIPNYEFVNGLTTLPKKRDVILAADSFSGEILRIDTVTHEITTAFKSPVLGYGNATEGLLIGVNGIRVKSGWLYFTNSRLGTFSRVKIDEDGFPVGGKEAEVGVIATLPGYEDGEHLWDDFDLDERGDAYVTAHPASLVKLAEGGRVLYVNNMSGRIVRVVL